MRDARMTTRTNAQVAAMLFGVVFLLVGVAGFIPGITTEYDRIDVYDAPGAELINVFAVNWIHNGVHLLFGLAGIAMAATFRAARAFLIGGGLIYLALWIYGLAIDLNSSANFVALNTADNWLHLGLGIGLLGSGIIFGAAQTRTRGRIVPPQEERRRAG